MVKARDELSVLIVGCGSIGKRHARVLRSIGVSDLRACDPVPGQHAALLADVPGTRMYATFEEGLADSPDTVLICTPPQLHIPQAQQGVRAGCHVLCEKPLSDTLEGVDVLAGLAAAEGKKVMVALCFRYHAGLLMAKRFLEEGQVGRLVSVRALMGEHLPEVRPDYRELVAAGFYGAFDLMHDLDLAIWYADRPIRQQHTVSGPFGLYAEMDTALPDVAEILLAFEDRRVATVNLDFFQRSRRRCIELIGTEGTIIVEFAHWDRCTVSVYDAGRRTWETWEIATERDDMFRAEDQEFLQAVAEDKPIACTIDEAVKSVRVVAAARAQTLDTGTTS
jgi:predicted dehydrogenase